MTDIDPVVATSVRIARALDVTEKRLAIEYAYAILAPIAKLDIRDVKVLRARVAVAIDVLEQQVGRTTVPQARRGQCGALAYPDEVAG